LPEKLHRRGCIRLRIIDGLEAGKPNCTKRMVTWMERVGFEPKQLTSIRVKNLNLHQLIDYLEIFNDRILG
jgi:hypothetical protein